MNKNILATVSVVLISLCMAGPADAYLASRLGGQAYYDDVLDITWLADANAAGTRLSWSAANAWAAGLNVEGVTGWRLPTLVDTGASGCNRSFSGTDCGFNAQTGTAATTVYSELASLWYDTLGNVPYFDTAGNPIPISARSTNHSGPFSNLEYDYWFDQEHVPYPDDAYYFSVVSGDQNVDLKTELYSAWAVHSGDVGELPEPATAWLIVSGLIGMIGSTRRKVHIF